MVASARSSASGSPARIRRPPEPQNNRPVAVAVAVEEHDPPDRGDLLADRSASQPFVFGEGTLSSEFEMM